MSAPDLIQQISALLKQGRAARKWNQTRLAVESGVSMTVVQGVEQGLRTPSVRTLMLLFQALRIDPTLTGSFQDVPPTNGQESPPTTQTMEALPEASPLQVSPPTTRTRPAREEIEPEDISQKAGDELIVAAFKKRFPDPAHVAARTYLEEHPEVQASISRLTSVQGVAG